MAMSIATAILWETVIGNVTVNRRLPWTELIRTDWLCQWLTLMYCVKVEKVREHQKYEIIAWLVIGVVHDSNAFCDEDGA